MELKVVDNHRNGVQDQDTDNSTCQNVNCKIRRDDLKSVFTTTFRMCHGCVQ